MPGAISFFKQTHFSNYEKDTHLLLLLCFFLLNQQSATAQTARLGIQGILKKANGNAVDDGTYSLRFRLYEQAEGGTHIWQETQPDVEVVGGIYTAHARLRHGAERAFCTPRITSG